jgi:outer membrane protein OmpA-like peptidoglycan-associated protein
MTTFRRSFDTRQAKSATRPELIRARFVEEPGSNIFASASFHFEVPSKEIFLVKPSRSLVPIALLCGLVSASGAGANPQDVLRLAQGGPPQTDDKNGGGDKENKDHKNRGGKGQDHKDEGGKGPDRPDRGPRERNGGNGNEAKQKPPPKQEEKKAPPQKQPEPTPVKPRKEKQAPSSSYDRFRKQENQEPKNGPPPSNGSNNAPKIDNQPARKSPPSSSYDRFREPKNQEPKKVPPPVVGGGAQQKPGVKPPLPPAVTPSVIPKDAGRKDDNRKDWDRRDADRGGPPNGGPGRPERGRWSGGKPAAPSEAHDINDLKSKRRERSEDGGRRVIIEEPDKRRIVREGGRTIIRHDETERFRRIAPNTRREKRNGLDISVTLLPGGIQIFTDLDDEGRPLRRYRRDRDGRDIVLFDNRDYYRRSRGGSFLDAIIDLPPPRLRIPRERYIVEYEGASDDDIYDTLDAGPVDDLDRGYSLEEVRRSPMLRDRMRRIDLDTVNFEFGSWTVDDNQYGALERVARAMNRIIDRNPGEMFLIEGHTDAVGSDDDNLSLSDRRAESVAIILTEEFGVPPENLTTQGYGEQYLKVPTDGPERLNRRVALRKITPLLAR